MMSLSLPRPRIDNSIAVGCVLTADHVPYMNATYAICADVGYTNDVDVWCSLDVSCFHCSSPV